MSDSKHMYHSFVRPVWWNNERIVCVGPSKGRSFVFSIRQKDKEKDVSYHRPQDQE